MIHSHTQRYVSSDGRWCGVRCGFWIRGVFSSFYELKELDCNWMWWWNIEEYVVITNTDPHDFFMVRDLCPKYVIKCPIDCLGNSLCTLTTNNALVNLLVTASSYVWHGHEGLPVVIIALVMLFVSYHTIPITMYSESSEALSNNTEMYKQSHYCSFVARV